MSDDDGLSRAQAAAISDSLLTLADQATELAYELQDDTAAQVPGRLKSMAEETRALAELAQRYEAGA